MYRFVIVTSIVLLFPIMTFAKDDPITQPLTQNRGKIETTTSGVLKKLEDPKRPFTTTSAQMKARMTATEMIKEKRASMEAETRVAKVEFQTQLAKIKDEKKKEIATKIDTKLSEVNKNRTDKMSKALDSMNALLDKLSTKSAQLKAAGKDTTALDAAITTAQSAISTSSTTIAAQAAKQYTAQITTEATLKTNFGSEVSQLEADLRAANQTVIDAKQAVQKAVLELKKLVGDVTSSTATSGAK